MDLIILEAKTAKSAIQLCVDRGIPSPFSPSDVDLIVNDSDLDEASKLAQIARVHRAVHEVLYAPPGRG